MNRCTACDEVSGKGTALGGVVTIPKGKQHVYDTVTATIPVKVPMNTRSANKVGVANREAVPTFTVARTVPVSLSSA